MQTYTVFVTEADGRGTTYITSVEADSVDQAKEMALQECSKEWGSGGENYDRDDLRILGVAEGDVNIVEWSDQE